MQLRRFVPGITLTLCLAAAAVSLQRLEVRFFSQPVLESLVLGILLGLVYRNVVGVGAQFLPGLHFCAKPVLEAAVLLLGATMNLGELVRGGPRLFFAIAVALILTLFISTLIGRYVFGLGKKPATLIAVGNAICGNSAIAAIAPLIGASAAEVAGAVAFTAVLGVGLVLVLPLVIFPLGYFSQNQYGTLVGMTVYAVPQVLAASFPVGEIAGQTATLVKLTRVMFLAPVALFYSLTRHRASASRPTLATFLPWFIVGFLLLAGLRTLALIPTELALLLKEISRLLTVMAMVALGLGVDLRALRAAGPRTIGAVTLSLLFLLAVSSALIKLLHLA